MSRRTPLADQQHVGNSTLRSIGWMLVWCMVGPVFAILAWWCVADLADISAGNEQHRQKVAMIREEMQRDKAEGAAYGSRLIEQMEAGLPIQLDPSISGTSSAARDPIIAALLVPREAESAHWYAHRANMLYLLIDTPEDKAKWGRQVAEVVAGSLADEPRLNAPSYRLLAYLGSEAKLAIDPLLRTIDFQDGKSMRDVGVVVMAIDPQYDLMPHVIETIRAHPDNGYAMFRLIDDNIPKQLAVRSLRQAIKDAPTPDEKNQLVHVLNLIDELL